MNKHQLNPDQQRAKAGLKELGGVLRAENRKQRTELREILQTQAENKPRGSYLASFSWSKVLVPAGSLLAVIVLMVAIAPKSGRVYPTSIGYPEPNTDYAFEETAMTGSAMSAPSTFKRQFIDDLGSNAATDGEVQAYRDEYGDAFEQNLSIDVLAKRQEQFEEISQLFQGSDGYIASFSDHGGNSRSINGHIPVEQLDHFKQGLVGIVGSYKFMTQSSYGYNRVPDLIAIDEKITEVEAAIAELEEKIANEQNLSNREELEQQLAQHQQFLAEREATKDEIEDRVEYVDISLYVNHIPSWWQAGDYHELRQSFAGYTDPSLGQKVLINFIYVVSKLLVLLSYTFWLIIPFLIWRWRRSRERKMFQALD